jgi:hypothetical protein
MRQDAPDKPSGGMLNNHQRNAASTIRNHPPLRASPAVALSEKAEKGQKHKRTARTY